MVSGCATQSKTSEMDWILHSSNFTFSSVRFAFAPPSVPVKTRKMPWNKKENKVLLLTSDICCSSSLHMEKFLMVGRMVEECEVHFESMKLVS